MRVAAGREESSHRQGNRKNAGKKKQNQKLSDTQRSVAGGGAQGSKRRGAGREVTGPGEGREGAAEGASRRWSGGLAGADA